MILCRNLAQTDTISSLQEWFAKCPPKGKNLHWVDGRSAKETAKHWMYIIPQPFRDLLGCFNLHYQLCSPEYVSRFDNLTGNGRNHDLLVVAEDALGEKVIISVESKVDEPFDRTVKDYFIDIQKKKENNTPTQADVRIQGLKQALLPDLSLPQFDELKYQLLAAIAGTLSEAKKQGANSAFFVVQTFISQQMDSVRHRKNQRDLDFLLEVISHGNYKIIHDGNLVGPFRVNGNDYIPDDVDLWIGKYSIPIQL